MYSSGLVGLILHAGSIVIMSLVIYIIIGDIIILIIIYWINIDLYMIRLLICIENRLASPGCNLRG